MLTISEAAKKYDITVRALRYYEEAKLINSERNSNNIRCYGADALKRIELVVILRTLDLPIKQIEQLLSAESVGNLNALLKNEMSLIETQLQRLKEKQWAIRALMDSFGSEDASSHHLLAFLEEHMYDLKGTERMAVMEETKEWLVIEIGVGLVGICCDKLLPAIKALRQSLESDYDLKIEPIRLRDVTEIEATEFRLLEHGKEILRESVVGQSSERHVDQIITGLKSVLLRLE